VCVYVCVYTWAVYVKERERIHSIYRWFVYTVAQDFTEGGRVSAIHSSMCVCVCVCVCVCRLYMYMTERVHIFNVGDACKYLLKNF